MYKTCEECGNEYKPFFKSRQKYCSYECTRIVQNRRQNEKLAKSLITGVIFGRPLWEDAFLRCKRRANRRGLNFNLTKDYFKDNRNIGCYYCGDKMLRLGIDRVDSNKGYLKSNAVVCCGKCNVMKRRTTQQGFIEQCKKIAKKHFWSK